VPVLYYLDKRWEYAHGHPYLGKGLPAPNKREETIDG